MEIVKLLLENNQLSAAKLAEKIGVASRYARLHYLWRDCGKCGSECIGCEKGVV